MSYGGLIRILPDMEPSETLATFVHELAHEMLHRAERRTLTTKAVRETEAEAVAFVVCHALGLETGTGSADYIQLYHGDANLLRESLEVVQRTSTVILGTISPKDAVGASVIESDCQNFGTCCPTASRISYPHRKRTVDDSGHRGHPRAWPERSAGDLCCSLWRTKRRFDARSLNNLKHFRAGAQAVPLVLP